MLAERTQQPFDPKDPMTAIDSFAFHCGVATMGSNRAFGPVLKVILVGTHTYQFFRKLSGLTSGVDACK